MDGGDKILLSVAGRTILERIVARLEPQVATLALNANGEPERFRGVGLAVFPDSMPGRLGPLAGILSAMEWARQTCPAGTDIVTIPGDTPFLPHDFVSRLLAVREACDAPIIVAASQGRRHPVAGLWRVGLSPSLRQALLGGMRKVTEFVELHGAAIASFSASPFDPFMNVNTPGDLAQAERLAIWADRDTPTDG